MIQKDVKKPNLNDYMAGALLSNGIIWMWAMAVNILQPFMPTEDGFILGSVTFIVFIGAGIIASYLVIKRSSSDYLKVLLKLVASEIIFSIIFILSFVNPSVELITVLFFSFVVGGLVGLYLAARPKLINKPTGKVANQSINTEPHSKNSLN
ncbi:hypothetical protein KEJ21_06390 [Candidatus Bathyarchaeota archaeon]|nr:hypothetical protein [Candidatus Bathyarchaeota archaeon]MBS7630205.1 hypothetical protein [Candidatus Bathyarchaeota archaeon]